MSAGTTTYLSWRWKRCSTTFGSFKFLNPHTLCLFRKSTNILFFPLLGIILNRIHKNLKLCFQLMDLGSRYITPLKNTSRNDKASRIIYEWGTCTCTVRRLRLEIINVEILQHPVDKYLFGIGVVYVYYIYVYIYTDYRNRLIFKICRNFRFSWFVK